MVCFISQVEQFFEVFEKYNASIWPLNIIMYLLAVAILGLIFANRRYSDKIVNGILSFFLIWMGIGYHIMFFSEIITRRKLLQKTQASGISS